MFNIMICDKDTEYVRRISSLIKRGSDNYSIEINVCDSGREFLEKLRNGKKCDWLILDVHMGGENAYEVAEVYRRMYPKGILYFCSHNLNKTIESFYSKPFRLIKKDDSEDNVLEYVREEVGHLGECENKIYFLGYTQTDEFTIYAEDLLFIENKKNEVVAHVDREIYHYDDNEDMILQYELTDLYMVLIDEGFEYGSDRYLINMEWVESIKNSKVTLKDGTRLQLSRSMRKKFLDRLSDKKIGLC